MRSDNDKGATLADSVEKRLLEYLRENHTESGALLPKETELAESLKISRHMVREGLSRLKALRVVEARKRRGTVLCRPDPFAGFQKLAEAELFTGKDRMDFMELRIAIELGMCDFVFARRSKEKLAALREAAGETGSSVQQISMEMDFHSRLIDVAGNPAVSDFRQVLRLAFGSMDGNGRLRSNLRTPSHQEICDVLERGTAEEFRTVMRQHFQPYLNFTLSESQKEGLL